MHTYNEVPFEFVDGYRNYNTHGSHYDNERIGPLVPFLTGFVAGAPFWSRPPGQPFPNFFPYPYPYPYPLPIFRPRPFPVYRPRPYHSNHGWR